MPNILSPSADNLLLGAGVVLFDRFDDAGLSTGYTHLGNCERFEITTEDSLLDKNESMTAARALYKRVARSRTTTVRVGMDEFSLFNVALGFMGEQVASAAQVATPVVDEAVWPDTKPGKYFNTAKIGPITGVSVDFGAATGVLGTDYEIVDANLGLIRVLPTTILTGAVTVSYTPTAYASGWNQIRGGTKSFIKGALKFIGDPASGPPYMVDVWRAAVTPDGAVGLISEEWAQMGLIFAIESDTSGHPLEPLFRVTELPYTP